MGEVYEAENTITGARRALKVIRGEYLSNQDIRVRFIREATLATQLKHPHVVEVWDPFFEGELVVLPMELLQGETLAARIRRARADNMPIPFDAIIEIALAAASGIGAFHKLGLIHRDLKPGNVFLARMGDCEVVKVLDFGTVRAMHGQRHTGSGLVIGSPTYMAPEQAMGASDLDARVDVYSLGVMLYEMVTGRRPYETDDHGNALSKLISNHAYAPPEVLRASIPDALQRVIVCALARHREARFASMEALEGALRGSLPESAQREPRDSMTAKPAPVIDALMDEPTVMDNAQADDPLPALPTHGWMTVALVSVLAIILVAAALAIALSDPPPSGKEAAIIATSDAGIFVPDAAAQPSDAFVSRETDAARTRLRTPQKVPNHGLWLDPH